jgi:hypothetical protein
MKRTNPPRARRSTQPLGVMKITTACHSDLDEAVGCLATTFAQDSITGFLLQTSQGYRERVTHSSRC